MSRKHHKPQHHRPGDAPTASRPFEPRPRLLAGLLVGYGVWLAALLTMYFTTVGRAGGL